MLVAPILRCLSASPSPRVTDSRWSTVQQLKPDDREEYFAHKQAKAPPDTPNSEQKKQDNDKDVRIGLAKPR